MIERWNDVTLSVDDRVSALVDRMSIADKVAQLHGIWIGASSDGGGVAPRQNDMGEPIDFEDLLVHGLGQVTRAFGTEPVDPALGAIALANIQVRVAAANRYHIPAIAHEECLAGFTTWGATIYPVPLSWGATFDPDLIQEVATRIGASMRAVGIHQGLAPVLDVTRDPRWGRTEETIGEDPYLVGAIGTAYVRGLESTGIVATLKHFVGYAASKAGRNLAPVSMGPREIADVLLPPFEMALREGGARSVMHSYADVDGMPAAANEALLTGLLRDTWGFDGTVVADYFGIGFLKVLHGVAETWGEAAALALRAGVDVELPAATAYRGPLLDEIAAGRVPIQHVDRALRRVLRQKIELGLLDPDWDPVPPALAGRDLSDREAVKGSVVLDSVEDRVLAARVAERAVVLLENDGILPLATPGRIAVVGPCADDPMALLGCYSFPNHVGIHHPEVPLGVDLPTVVAALRAELPATDISYEQGCSVDGIETAGIALAVEAARAADLTIAVLGDRSGLFGLGTSGEGCDAESMQLPGVQASLLEALLDTGTPVVLVLVSGRPYALGTAPERASAIVQTFFPGEEGAAAIAGVITGRIEPAGRLPVSVPKGPGGQPATYLAAILASKSSVSNLDPTARYPFGHGLSYTHFAWSDLRLDGVAEAADSTSCRTIPTDGSVRLGLIVKNTGSRSGSEVVQLYLHDPVASVVRPVVRLIGFARIELAPGEAAHVSFEIPADVTSFTGRDGARVVEPGDLQFRLGSSSADIRLSGRVRLAGPTRRVDHTRALHCRVTVES